MIDKEKRDKQELFDILIQFCTLKSKLGIKEKRKELLSKMKSIYENHLEKSVDIFADVLLAYISVSMVVMSELGKGNKK